MISTYLTMKPFVYFLFIFLSFNVLGQTISIKESEAKVTFVFPPYVHVLGTCFSKQFYFYNLQIQYEKHIYTIHSLGDISWNISIVGDISNFFGSHMRDISKVYDFGPEISPLYEISHQISPICESPQWIFFRNLRIYRVGEQICGMFTFLCFCVI